MGKVGSGLEGLPIPPMTRSCGQGGSRLKRSPRSARASTPEVYLLYYTLGEGNGTPLQYSLPGKSMDGGARWAAVHGVAKSQTRLSDFTFTFHFSCIGEGNGNPLQCSCLENPRDGGAWWAAVYGVAQSQTRLKRLNSSSQRRRGKRCGFDPQIRKIP